MTHIRSVLVPATFGALAAVSAHAQTLTLHNGDNVIVSGTGTVGMINGAPVAYATNSYVGSHDFYAIRTSGTSTFALGAGGTITAGQYAPDQYSTALDVEGNGATVITGGVITGDQYGTALAAVGNGQVTVMDGTITSGQNGFGIYTYGSSTVLAMTGGAVIAPDDSIGLFANANSTINLFSQSDTPFLINGIAMNNTTLSLYSNGTISGTLLNGDILNTTFYNAATINLNVAPEPSSRAGLGLGTLGLVALTLRARRRRAA